jgi:hypothetical protein
MQPISSSPKISCKHPILFLNFIKIIVRVFEFLDANSISNNVLNYVDPEVGQTRQLLPIDLKNRFESHKSLALAQRYFLF